MSQAYRANQGADETTLLRQRLTDPPSLVRELGLERGMQRISQGAVLVRCPAHNDSTASCSVKVGEDRTIQVNCFGCDLRGNVFHLIAAVRGLDVQRSFPAVLDEARRLAGLAPRAAGAPASASAPRPSLRVVGPTAAERRFSAGAEVLLELTQLCDLAGTGGEVAASLAFRGLLDEARADGWGVLPLARRGVDADGEAAVENLETPLLAALDERGALPALHWLTGEQGWKHPQHRLLVPWRGPGGRLWTVQRRWVRADGDTQASPPKGGMGKYLFPPAASHEPTGAWPYGWDQAEGSDAAEVWLCEGAVDTLALRALNRRGALRAGGGPRSLVVLGLAGLQSWGKVRDDVLQLVRGRRAFVALDGDEAAEKAADTIGPELWRAGAVDVKRTRPKVGKDWAEWLASEVARRGPCW